MSYESKREMLRLRRAGPFGKILEVYRGKRTKFSDVDAKITNIDIKGDIVDTNANLLYPYSEDNEQDCKHNDSVYSNVVESMSRQITRILAKKSRAFAKRGQIKTTSEVQQHRSITEQKAELEEKQIELSHENIISAPLHDQEETDSLIESVFANVSESEMLQLLERLEDSQVDGETQQHSEDDEDCNKDDDDDEKENDADHVDENEDLENDNAWPADEEDEEFDGGKNAQLISTLYDADGTIIESGPIDVEEMESDDDDTHHHSASDVSSSDDDEEAYANVSLFEDHVDHDSVLVEHDFDMYDGLEDLYAL